MNDFKKKITTFFQFGLLFLTATVLLRISFQNYLLFHSLTELFSIVISFGVFTIAWNSRKYLKNHYLMVVGIAYLFIGFLDLLHTISYTGMNIFTDYDFYANQLWIIARYMEAATLLGGFLFRRSKRPPGVQHILLLYFAVTAFAILSVFTFKIFPVCFIAGKGQTHFKIISEFIIIFLLLGALGLLFKTRKSFSPSVYKYLFFSVILTMTAETAFIFYVENYGLSNLIGHFAKLGSFYLIYKALIETGLKRPYDLIFHDLEKQRTELEQANQTKEKLLSVMAHDLSNSVNAVTTFTKLVLETDEPSEQKPLLLNLENAAESAADLLKKLLLWSKAVSNKLIPSFQIIKLHDLFQTIKQTLKPQLDKKQITLEKNFDESLSFEGDFNMLETVLRNLITNAIKFTPKGGRVSLNGKKDYNQVTIMVADTGTGIPEDLQKKLFTPDARKTTKGTENEPGNGLGLLICKEFTELNNGEISVESKKGEGSRFIIKLKQKKSYTASLY